MANGSPPYVHHGFSDAQDRVGRNAGVDGGAALSKDPLARGYPQYALHM
jgi:hypothetical protein